MSNLTVVLMVVFISFFTCAIFMSAYKEDWNDVLNDIVSAGRNNAKLIRAFADEIDILRARVYDLENKLKELETTDDGK